MTLLLSLYLYKSNTFAVSRQLLNICIRALRPLSNFHSQLYILQTCLAKQALLSFIVSMIISCFYLEKEQLLQRKMAYILKKFLKIYIWFIKTVKHESTS